jgi:mannan endo-1,4-beta-mannosidase
LEGSVSPSQLPMATFVLDGQPFCFAGTNNYYLTYKSHRMTDDVLESAKRMGLAVIRIWANIDRGSLDGTVRSVDGAGNKDGVYFQYWDTAAKRPAFNDGASGLEHLDYVLHEARKLGLKVMLVLTNNWKEFGGMDQYVVWFGLKQHHAFYTDPSARQAYKAWAAHLALRRNSMSGVLYRDDPTIFSWELANEPRCWNGGDFDDRPACSVKPVVSWAEEMSSAIKSLDPNHLVSIGDEGFFARAAGWGYDGSDGIDHDALIALSHIDFGTFHLYPDTWGQSFSWSLQWIEDHIAAARSAGKPTLLEEYGVAANRSGIGGEVDSERRDETFPRWHEVLQKRGANAALFWMLAGHDDSKGVYPDYDQFTIYEKDGVAPLLRSFASRMTTDAQACVLYRSLVPANSMARTPFVTTAPPPARTQAQVDHPAGGDRS